MEAHGPLLPMESGEGVLKFMDATHLYSLAQDAHSMPVVRQENVPSKLQTRSVRWEIGQYTSNTSTYVNTR